MKDGIANRLGFFKVEKSKDDNLKSAMVDRFKDFIRMGGTISLDQWLNLDTDTQVALAEAGDEVYAERADLFITNLIAMGAEALLEAGQAQAGEDVIMSVLEEAAKAGLNGKSDE